MPGLIEKYHRFLPIDSRWIVTLGEGDTPLLPAPRLAEWIFGGSRRGTMNRAPALYLKFEGANPTGSFKDRGMTYAISKALESGARAVICASTGNTAASAVAYAARAGLQALIVIPRGKVAKGKLAQAVIHGARVVAINGNFDQALELTREMGEGGEVAIVNSINPYRIEGQKTIAFEVCEVLGRPPTHHALPVGNAGNITAHWKGYKEWIASPSPVPPSAGHPLPQRGEGDKEVDFPKMMGFQAAGAAPIVIGRPVKEPKTVASAIRIGNPASWKEALKARDESEGVIDKVTDREILAAYRMIASLEGVFCEPASAAGVAGVKKYSQKGYFQAGDLIVCTLTGHGLKDPETAFDVSPTWKVVSPKLAEVRKALKL